MRPTLILALLALKGLASAETVHGTLVDPTGRPIVGTKLSGFALTHTGKSYKVFDLRATTGKGGAFTLDGTPSKPTAAVPILLMAQRANGGMAPVRLTQEGERVVWRAVPTATLSLVAIDARGKPVPGATAWLTSAILSNPGITNDTPLIYDTCLADDGLSLKTDAQGVAQFGGIPVGAMTQFRMTRDGMLSGRGNVKLPAEGAEQKLTLGDGGAILSGRLLRAGRPVPGVEVVAHSLVDHTVRETRARTDANGLYRIGDAYPGRVSLSADLGALAQDWVAIGPTAVPLRPGEERDGLNLTLEPGIVLRGQALTVGGKPVANARVWASGPNEGRIDRTTDAQGRFTFRGMPGEWYVAIDEVGDRQLNQQTNLRATVDASHNPPLELRIPDAVLLPSIPHLTGLVKDADGKPVAGARVTSLRGRDAATTGADGRFRFESAVAPGSLLLATKDEAISTRTTTILEQSDVALVLDAKTASIQGVLTDDDGKPVPGVALTLGGEAEGGYFNAPDTKTDANGAYRFDGLYGGADHFFLWAKKPGYGPVTIQPIVTKPGERKILETHKMALADGIIDGTVVDENGKPTPGVTVSSQVDGVPETITDAGGRFHLTGVPRGKQVLVAVRKHGYGSPTDAATGQTDVTIKLRPESAPMPGLVTGNLTGHMAPAIRVAEWTNGGPVDLTALRGKIVVLDLWAVWCGPCVASLPDVQRLSARYAAKGVVVLGVHAPGTPKAKVAAFVKEKGLTYPVALDVAEPTGSGVTAKAFGYTGIPHVLVIDAKGQVAVDTDDIAEAEKAIRKLLGGS